MSKNRQRLHAGRPWQRVAIDLVGPFSLTPCQNAWILVLTDHFTRWQDTIPIMNETAPHVAFILDARVFCYFGLPEQIHSDQGAQFESELVTELCKLLRVDKTRTIPYHPQGNGMVERNNRPLGDSLRVLIIDIGHENWDLVIPQILRAFRAAPHSLTQETANSLMLGRELPLPDDSVYEKTPSKPAPRNIYVQQTKDHPREAHDFIRKRELDIRMEDTEEPPLYSKGDLVWLVSKRKYGRGISRKLQPKFLGP